MKMLLRIVRAIIESWIIVGLIDSVRIDDVNKAVRSMRLAAVIGLLIMSPFLLLRLIFKTTDMREEAFILDTLQKALSYNEWRCFDAIWEIVKDKLPPSFEGMSEENQQKNLFQLLIFLSEVEITKKRLEEREEYICQMTDHCLTSHNFSDDKMKQDVERLRRTHGERYDQITKDATYYEQIYRGIEPVFMRKPMGTRSKGCSFVFSSLPRFMEE